MTAFPPSALDQLADAIHLLEDLGHGLEFGQAGAGIDMCLIDEARSHFMRGEYRDALWNLEKALGNDFAGLSEITLEGDK